MWVWNVLDHLSDVISFRPQLADTSGFWMFLDVFGTYRAKIGSRSRPEDPKDLTRVPSLVSPRHGKQYSLLEPLGCNRICHTDRVCKRGFLYVSMRISGTKHDAKLRRLTYIYIYSIYIIRRNTPISRGCTYSEWETGQWRRQSVENWGPRARFPRFPRLRARNNCNHFASDLCWALLRPGPIRNQESPAGRCFSGLSVENSWQFPAASMRFCFPPCQLSIFILSTDHQPKFDSDV
jgi:hypothetical protein